MPEIEEDDYEEYEGKDILPETPEQIAARIVKVNGRYFTQLELDRAVNREALVTAHLSQQFQRLHLGGYVRREIQPDRELAPVQVETVGPRFDVQFRDELGYATGQVAERVRQQIERFNRALINQIVNNEMTHLFSYGSGELNGTSSLRDLFEGRVIQNNEDTNREQRRNTNRPDPDAPRGAGNNAPYGPTRRRRY